MTILRMGKQGQSLTEYAILFSVVAAAYLGMQLYFKRGVQAKIKGVSDHFAQTASDTTGALNQYEPYYTAESSYDVTQRRDADVEVKEGFTVAKEGIAEHTDRAVGGHETQGTDLGADNHWQ
jgi:hypothetical protein